MDLEKETRQISFKRMIITDVEWDKVAAASELIDKSVKAYTAYRRAFIREASFLEALKEK